MKYKVMLSARVNPDFGRGGINNYWNRNIKPRPCPAKSLRDASECCRLFIQMNELGGGNWTGGDVFDESGAKVAIISYNGRVWTPDPNWKDRKEITNLDQ